MGLSPTDPHWEEMGDANIPPSLVALCPALPELLYCPYSVATGRFLYRRIVGTEDCGLVAFVTPQDAKDYIRGVMPWGIYTKVRQVSLDEAHDLALARHAFVNCLVVVRSNPWEPSIHYVR